MIIINISSIWPNRDDPCITRVPPTSVNTPLLAWFRTFEIMLRTVVCRVDSTSVIHYLNYLSSGCSDVEFDTWSRSRVKNLIVNARGRKI